MKWFLIVATLVLNLQIANASLEAQPIDLISYSFGHRVHNNVYKIDVTFQADGHIKAQVTQNPSDPTVEGFMITSQKRPLDRVEFDNLILFHLHLAGVNATHTHQLALCKRAITPEERINHLSIYQKTLSESGKLSGKLHLILSPQGCPFANLVKPENSEDKQIAMALKKYLKYKALELVESDIEFLD